jgi:hypothetical protein
MDLWMDLQNALAKLGKASSARASLQTRVSEASAELHAQIREGVDAYRRSIARTRRGAADCRSALQAQLDIIPSLGTDFEETASTLLALYRECNAFWRRKREPLPPPVPALALEAPKYNIDRELAKVNTFDAVLMRNEQELEEFEQRFEAYVTSVLGPLDPPASGTRGENESPPPGKSDGLGVRHSSNGDATIWPHR